MVDVYCKFTDRFYGVKEPSAPKQTQAPAQVIPEEQDQSEPQEETPEATTEIAQQSQEQITEATDQKAEETTDEGFQVEE